MRTQTDSADDTCVKISNWDANRKYLEHGNDNNMTKALPITTKTTTNMARMPIIKISDKVTTS